MSEHPCHHQELSRLNRISGQLEGIKKMIEDRRYCPEILVQIKAVRSALRSVENRILQTHIQSCVAQSFESSEERNRKLAELSGLLARFGE